MFAPQIGLFREKQKRRNEQKVAKRRIWGQVRGTGPNVFLVAGTPENWICCQTFLPRGDQVRSNALQKGRAIGVRFREVIPAVHFKTEPSKYTSFKPPATH
jgi:hypothetical protein